MWTLAEFILKIVEELVETFIKYLYKESFDNKKQLVSIDLSKIEQFTEDELRETGAFVHVNDEINTIDYIGIDSKSLIKKKKSCN